MVKMNKGLTHYTADEVAETIPYDEFLPDRQTANDLYVKLWGIVNEAENPTPQGGDGTNGTIETPDGRFGNFDDQTPYWWGKLTDDEQVAINKGYEAGLAEIEALIAA